MNTRFAVSLAQLDSEVDGKLKALQAELASLKLCAFDEEVEGRFEAQRISFDSELAASLEHRLTKQYLDIGESLARQRADFERALGERVDGRLTQLDGRLTEELSMQENRLKARLADLEATVEARMESRLGSPAIVERTPGDAAEARLVELEAAVSARLESRRLDHNAAFEARLFELEATLEERLDSRPLTDNAAFEARLESNLLLVLDRNMESRIGDSFAKLQHDLQSELEGHASRLERQGLERQVTLESQLTEPPGSAVALVDAGLGACQDGAS